MALGTGHWFVNSGQGRLGMVSSDHLNKSEHCTSPIYSYSKHSCLGIWVEVIWAKCTPRAKPPTSSLGICSHSWFPTPPLRLKNRFLFSHLKPWKISLLVLTGSHWFTSWLFLCWHEGPCRSWYLLLVRAWGWQNWAKAYVMHKPRCGSCELPLVQMSAAGTGCLPRLLTLTSTWRTACECN